MVKNKNKGLTHVWREIPLSPCPRQTWQIFALLSENFLSSVSTTKSVRTSDNRWSINIQQCHLNQQTDLLTHCGLVMPYGSTCIKRRSDANDQQKSLRCNKCFFVNHVWNPLKLNLVWLVGLNLVWIWVNIGSGNGLVPGGTKPLPEPMLTDWSSVRFSDIYVSMGYFTTDTSASLGLSLKLTWKLPF